MVTSCGLHRESSRLGNPVTETILRSGAKAEFTAATLFQAQHRLADIRRHTEEMLKGGVLVLPTCGGTWTREQVNTDPIATNSQMGLYTKPLQSA